MTPIGNDVTVVIPCYNHARFVKRAVDSAIQNNFLAIVVDDCSTDNFKEISRSLPAQVISHRQNRGVAAARNTAIRASSTPWIFTLDADDYLLPGVLDKMLLSADGADVVCGNIARWDGTAVRPNISAIPHPLISDFTRACLPFAGSLFTRKIWEKARGFDESREHFEDWFFWTKCAYVGAQFRYLDILVYQYNKQLNSRCDWLVAHQDELVIANSELFAKFKKDLEETEKGEVGWGVPHTPS